MGDFGLAEAMMGLKRDGATGTLQVLAGEKRTHIQWLAGKPVYADATVGGETLGRLLLRQGHLTSGQYRVAIDKMTDRLSANEEIRFGQVVVEMGFLKVEQIDVALVDQVRWRIVHALECEEPTWEFVSGKNEGKNRLSFEVEALVLLAMRWIAPERLDAFLEEHAEKTPVLVATKESLASFGLVADEVALAAQLDGKRTLRSIVEQASAKVDARAILALCLLVDGCAKSPPKLPAAAPDSKPRRAPFARITTKQLQAVRPPAPPPAATAPGQAAAPAPAAAPATPEPNAPKSPPVWKDAPVVAEQAFQAGQYHMETGNLPKALNLFRFAAELSEDRVEYRLYALWLEWRKGGATDAATELLLATAHDAAVQDPNLGFPRYVMGHLALHRGDRDRAARLFRFAVKLDPLLSDAMARDKGEQPTPVMNVAVVTPVVVGRVVVVSEPPLAPTPTPPTSAAEETPTVLPAVATIATSWSPEGLLLEAASEALSQADVAPEAPSVPTEALFRAAKPVVADAEPEPAPAAAPPAISAPLSSPPTPAEPASPAAHVPASSPPSAAEPAPKRAEPAPPRALSSSRPAPPPAPASGRPRWAIVAVVVIALGVVGAVAVSMRERPTEPTTTNAPTTAAPPPASAVATPPPSTSVVLADAPKPATAPSASAPPGALPEAPRAEASAPVGAAPADGMGEIVIAEAGHRVWIDGKLVGETPLTYKTACGSHSVRVGSSGKPRTVDVACTH